MLNKCINIYLYQKKNRLCYLYNFIRKVGLFYNLTVAKTVANGSFAAIPGTGTTKQTNETAEICPCWLCKQYNSLPPFVHSMEGVQLGFR
jgi:hypothetical protein